MAAGPKLMDQLKDYQKLLERTERELFETKMELSTKVRERERKSKESIIFIFIILERRIGSFKRET